MTLFHYRANCLCLMDVSDGCCKERKTSNDVLLRRQAQASLEAMDGFSHVALQAVRFIITRDKFITETLKLRQQKHLNFVFYECKLCAAKPQSSVSRGVCIKAI